MNLLCQHGSRAIAIGITAGLWLANAPEPNTDKRTFHCDGRLPCDPLRKQDCDPAEMSLECNGVRP